jgi:serine/threonine-protein kinase
VEQDSWRRAGEIFHAALERPQAARAAFLDAACAGDAGLRRQVEVLLRQDAQAGSFLEHPVVAGPAAVPAVRGSLGGRQLGSYHLISLLGAGGMGEVYRAHDDKLGRDVAVKVLPPEFASDPGRVARLRREARALAALNHPNIATIHGLEETADHHCLVLELVEGDTPKGPLPLAAALDVAGQVAEALQAAHGHGIVHRDLKPANLKVTPEGRVKVLDFGLAKALGESDGTLPGDVVGTPGYMSPEQARGAEVDQRTDIWAFGCLLFELLTGRRAFAGSSPPGATVAAAHGEPDWEALPARTPARVRGLLRQCLERDASRRLQRISEALSAIREARTGRRMMWPMAAAAVLIVIASVAVATVVGGLRRPSPAPSHFALTMPGPTVLGVSPSSKLAVSADGLGVVYLGRSGERSQLYWHDLHGQDGWPLAGTEGGDTPLLSPDGQWLVFFREDALLKLPLRGGRVAGGAIEVTRAASFRGRRGAAWSGDGTIVYGALDDGLWQVASAGGQARQLTRADRAKHEGDHRWPSFLPGGREVLFTVSDLSGWPERGAIAVLSLDTGRVARVLNGYAFARYLRGGHLVAGRNGSLHAVAFDPKTMKPSGSALPVLADVVDASTGYYCFDVAGDGTGVYASASHDLSGNTMVWVSRSGDVEPAVPDRRAYQPVNFALSPDGDRVAATVDDDAGRANIWILDVRDRRSRQLRLDADCHAPTWSPRGDRLAFASTLEGPPNLYVMPAAGGTAPVRLGLPSSLLQRPASWSPDGRFLAYEVQTRERLLETRILPLDGGRQPWRWEPEGTDVCGPAFSPDGRALAYQARESGTWRVWARPFPGPGPKLPVSGGDGGLTPAWEGDEIYYVERPGDTRIMSRRVESTAPLRLAPARRVAFALPFPLSNDPHFVFRPFAVEPGGRRVLVVQPEGRAPLNALHVIGGWPEEVRATLRRGR